VDMVRYLEVFQSKNITRLPYYSPQTCVMSTPSFGCTHLRSIRFVIFAQFFGFILAPPILESFSEQSVDQQRIVNDRSDKKPGVRDMGYC
jgi:hypothetical protein